jgi:hypothetical protein
MCLAESVELVLTYKFKAVTDYSKIFHFQTICSSMDTSFALCFPLLFGYHDIGKFIRSVIS